MRAIPCRRTYGLAACIIDHSNSQGPLHYVFPGDDLLIFADDRRALGAARREIDRFLLRLRLRTHAGKGQVTPTRRPLPYLGFVVSPDRLRVMPQNITLARHRTRLREIEFSARRIPVESYRSSIFGWPGYARLGGQTRCVIAASGAVRWP